MHLRSARHCIVGMSRSSTTNNNDTRLRTLRTTYFSLRFQPKSAAAAAYSVNDDNRDNDNDKFPPHFGISLNRRCHHHLRMTRPAAVLCGAALLASPFVVSIPPPFFSTASTASTATARALFIAAAAAVGLNEHCLLLLSCYQPMQLQQPTSFGGFPWSLLMITYCCSVYYVYSVYPYSAAPLSIGFLV